MILSKYPKPAIKYLIALFTSAGLLVAGCDLISPEKRFKLAVPDQDYSYQYSAKHLKAFLESGGFEIEIVSAENAIDANEMVAKGEADLTFAMDSSEFIPEAIGPDAAKLRTIVPLFQRLFFLFSMSDVKTPASAAQLEGKSIGIEVLGGETNKTLTNILAAAKIDDVRIIDRDDNPDFIHFWGTYYGERATNLLDEGWGEMSIEPGWINFMTLNDPAIAPFVLPAIPGVEGSVRLDTISTRTLLVGGAHLQENSVYEMSKYLFHHKLDLVRYDKMYRFINESFDKNNLLFPEHIGTDKYLRRNQPSFFERYAEVMALIFSLGAIMYGAIQGVRNRLFKIKKERIDIYFLSYLEIRSQTELSTEEKKLRFNDLLQRAVVQLTNEKLDKDDFHVFSRLVQQELMLLGSRD